MPNLYYVPEQQQQQQPSLQQPQIPPSSPTDFFAHQQHDVMTPLPSAPWIPTQVGTVDHCESPLSLHASQVGPSWPDPTEAPFSPSSSSLLSHIEAQAQVPTTYSSPYTNQIEFRHHPQSAIPPVDPIPTSAPPSPVNTTGASSTTATSPVATSGGHASIAIRLSPLPGTSGIDIDASCDAGSSSCADGGSSPSSANTTNGSGNRKPPLACLFCRGRKIACGPPPPESTDKSCKWVDDIHHPGQPLMNTSFCFRSQCFRRQLKCEYPSESRRGMRKKKSSSGNVYHAGPKLTIKTGPRRRTHFS
jgi:hypothetical protein